NQCSNRSAAGMPAAVTEEQHEPQAAAEQIGEGDQISFAKAGRRIERRKGKVQRREDERLRIGDLWPARKHVRSPKRRLPARERGCEELQFGLELSLGIPRDRYL